MMKITKLSTLKALADGDIANAILSETPGGIEAQESQGQRDFVASETLPKERNNCTRQQLEQMGIVFGEDVDDLFVYVQLPDGWEKAATDHSMWSKLLDEQGRERAAIFYKAAFYDQRAHINLTQRFSYRIQPVGGFIDGEGTQGKQWTAVVMDCGQVIWESGQLRPEPEWSREDPVEWKAWMDENDSLCDQAQRWLDKKYPDWRDPLAYW